MTPPPPPPPLCRQKGFSPEFFILFFFFYAVMGSCWAVLPVDWMCRALLAVAGLVLLLYMALSSRAAAVLSALNNGLCCP